MSDIDVFDGEGVDAGTPININELDLDSLPASEAKKLTKTTLKEISERIVAELFRDLRVDVVSNLRCFEACVKRISLGNFFFSTRLARWGGYKHVLKMAISAKEAADRHGRVMVLPAPHLVAYWAAMDIRKLKGDAKDEATRILRILDAHRHVAAAISIFSQHQDMFFVNVKAVVAPTMTGERLEGYPVVQAVSGSPNRWTAYMTFGNDSVDENISVHNLDFDSNKKRLNGVRNFDQESTHDTFGSIMDLETHNESAGRLVKPMVDLTREEVMASAGDLFFKLAQPWRFSDEDLTVQVDAWISNDRVALLDETSRGHLWMWCTMNSHPWAEKIKALPKTYYSVLRRPNKQLQPQFRHGYEKTSPQHRSRLPRIPGFPVTRQQEVSHTTVLARADPRGNHRYRQPLTMQPRAVRQIEAHASHASHNTRNLVDAFNDVSFIADKLSSAVGQLGAILEEESQKRPQAASSDGYGSNESSSMPSLHFNALISLFHALGNENGDDIRASLAEFCDATNMSSRQRERAFNFL